MHRERDQERRERGLALAVGALGIAALPEAVLFLPRRGDRAGAAAGRERPRGGATASPSRGAVDAWSSRSSSLSSASPCLRRS
jgi:hypothetical protein